MTFYDHQIRVHGQHRDRYDEVLTPQALNFVANLDGMFAERRCDLLATRRVRRQRLLDGGTLDFLPETAHIRDDPSWRVAPPAPGLVDRRVEITGPTTRKMTVNALNSGATVWLADFEDSTSPTWRNIVEGQLNLIDALDRKIDFTSEDGKEYALGEHLPTIVVRPRGWHMVDKNVAVDGRPVSATLLDFGLYLFHCGKRQVDAGFGPYFYLPKLESHLEARLWNDVFNLAENLLGLERGTIRATVLIETITAAFEMDEILYELREHASGLNAGRWDYVFSILRSFRTREDFVLPDRSQITMTSPFMRAFTELLVSTCHRRGAHAIGGMAAVIPSREDPDGTERALAAVRADKEREARDGFDGTWVAHPDLVPVCAEVFDAALGRQPNQLGRRRDDVHVTAQQLLDVRSAGGSVTEAGLRQNIRVSLVYLEAWLNGDGAVGIDGLMEDAATVEISRSQVWTWLRHGTRLDDGRKVTPRLVERLVDEELGHLRYERRRTGGVTRLDDARTLFTEVALAEDFPSSITVQAYAEYLIGHHPELHVAVPHREPRTSRPEAAVA